MEHKTANDYGLKVGEVYRPRKGSRSSEREILWISADGRMIQYDGPAVRLGRHHPTVSVDSFVKWAGLDK